MNQAPNDAVFDAQRNVVVVSNADSDNLLVVDAAATKVSNTIPLAVNLNALAANPQRNRVYAADGATNSVVVIQDDRVIGQVPTGNNPVDLAVDSAAQRLYVAASADGTLTVIDEDTLQVVERQFITSTLTTVAVDSLQQKLFAGSYLLDLANLAPQTTFFARGLTLDSKTIPQFERANPALSKLYALASNGVPGSNARLTLYRFLYDAWNDPKLLGSKNGGNTTALAIDPTTNNLFATNTHPLAFNYGLDVFDAQDQLVQSLSLNSHTADMVVNPATHHLFLAHPPTNIPVLREPKPEFNTVEILDTRTLGRVGSVAVPNAPWRMARVGDKIYVAGQRDGVLTILGDAFAPRPPAPTPTLTPTPFPTWTPAPNVAPRATTAPRANVSCRFGPPPPFAELWLEYLAELGCPTDVAAEGNFAVQTFKGGYMFDDLRNPNAQKIYVLLPDQMFLVYDDTWREGDPERPCNEIQIPEGRIHPKRGFGKVWCEHPEIQKQLPGAVADEGGITLTVQDFERGMMWANTPRGVITLFQNGTWK
jgi:DNA-binding beta-propeller fold protein YncE